MSSQAISSRHIALQVLGLGDDATPDEIRKAYHRGVLRTHPDKGGSREAFEEIHKAYTFITNPPSDEFDEPEDYDEPEPSDEPTDDILSSEWIEMLLRYLDLSNSDSMPPPPPPPPPPRSRNRSRTHTKFPTKCRYWNGTVGSCRNGDKCKFSHQPVCQHYLHKCCKFGSKCKNLHPK